MIAAAKAIGEFQFDKMTATAPAKPQEDAATRILAALVFTVADLPAGGDQTRVPGNPRKDVDGYGRVSAILDLIDLDDGCRVVKPITCKPKNVKLAARSVCGAKPP